MEKDDADSNKPLIEDQEPCVGAWEELKFHPLKYACQSK